MQRLGCDRGLIACPSDAVWPDLERGQGHDRQEQVCQASSTENLHSVMQVTTGGKISRVAVTVDDPYHPHTGWHPFLEQQGIDCFTIRRIGSRSRRAGLVEIKMRNRLTRRGVQDTAALWRIGFERPGNGIIGLFG